MFKKTLLALCLVGSLMLQLQAASFTVAVENEPSRINPLYDEDHDALVDLIYSGLVYFDTSGKIQPSLATKWTISPDGKTYHFYLREGVKWHDGKPFTSEDVKFTIMTAKNPKLQSAAIENFRLVKDIKLPNKHEIIITLSKPFTPMLAVLAKGMLPKHLLKGKDINTAKFNQDPVGTGPYKFIKWKKGSNVILKANKDFYLGKVKNDGLNVRFIASSQMRALVLKSGEIDAALIEPAMRAQFNKKGFATIIMPSVDYRALSFNLDKPVFASKYTRQALNFTVNRKEMVEKLLHGLGSVATGPFLHTRAKDAFDFDTKQAKKLLKKAGWKKGKDGILVDKKGQKFAFSIYTFNTDLLRVKLSKVIASDLAKLGIKVSVQAKPSGSFDYTKVDSFLVGFGNPHDMGLENTKIFKTGSGLNFGHYSNKAVDATLLALNSSSSKEKRDMYKQSFVDELRADPAYLFMVFLEYPLVYKDGIKGVAKYTIGHHGAGFLSNVWNWSK